MQAEKASTDVETFERRESAEGRLLRYARSRVRHFAGRQILTATGALTLAGLVGPLVGLAGALLALSGEAVDCLYLRRLLHRGAGGALPPRAFAASVLTGSVQSATIAGCVALAWLSAAPGEARYFAMAYLAGAALNAGLLIFLHRAATRARLAIFAVTAAGLFLGDFAGPAEGPVRRHFDLLATVILAYFVAMLIRFVADAARRRRTIERELLSGKLEVERARVELAAREQAARRLALVAEHANDSIFLTDPEGRIEWANDAFTRVTGYTAAEAVGRHPGVLLDGPQSSLETLAGLAAARRQRRPYRGELLVRGKGGHAFWVETMQTPIFDAEGALLRYIAVERDVSTAKAREAELAEARAAAEQAAQAKANFLATMSHEMRTPLNGIIGMADLLVAGDLPPEGRQQAETIVQSGEALLTIIGDVLDASRLEAGEMALCPQPFAPGPTLASAVTLLRPLAERKGLALAFDPGEPPEHAVGDAGRIRQVLLNLGGNAVKFTQSGSVRVAARYDPDGLLRVAISDTGIGIAPDRLREVFASFVQAEAETGRRFGGTGLGLAISRRLAREMGGDITASSEPGRGSCFIASFRLGPADPPAEPPGPHAPAAPGDHLAGRHVLAVEDNHTNRSLIEKLLADTGLRLTLARNGAEGVACWRSLGPEVVLMDVAMPGMDGLAATRAIRAEEADAAGPGCAIIGLTANAFEEDRARCLEAGMTDFLTKPVRRDALFAALDAALAARPGRLPA